MGICEEEYPAHILRQDGIKPEPSEVQTPEDRPAL